MSLRVLTGAPARIAHWTPSHATAAAAHALDSYLTRARPALAARGAGSPALFLGALLPVPAVRGDAGSPGPSDDEESQFCLSFAAVSLKIRCPIGCIVFTSKIQKEFASFFVRK